ncbi:hypothetical protein BaRGS_00004210, partial [Batillaria attramentaria]
VIYPETRPSTKSRDLWDSGIQSGIAALVTTFFDIKRAFDTVWHAKLLDKLSSIGISGRLYQFVQAFLADRRISVRVGASLSDEHTLDMGVPQGSVIAPTLFSVMLHDIEAKKLAVGTGKNDAVPKSRTEKQTPRKFMSNKLRENVVVPFAAGVQSFEMPAA